jgi:hypothetical protein
VGKKHVPQCDIQWMEGMPNVAVWGTGDNRAQQESGGCSVNEVEALRVLKNLLEGDLPVDVAIGKTMATARRVRGDVWGHSGRLSVVVQDPCPGCHHRHPRFPSPGAKHRERSCVRRFRRGLGDNHRTMVSSSRPGTAMPTGVFDPLPSSRWLSGQNGPKASEADKKLE